MQRMQVREHPKYGEGLESLSASTAVVSVRFQRKTRFIRLMAVEFSGSLDQAATRYRCVFRVANCSSPTFLPPLAPRPLRRFHATMEALTPARLSPAYRSPCLTYSTFLTIPSPTTRCLPVVALPRYVLSLSATDLPVAFQRSSRAYFPHGSRLRHWPAGSPRHPAETGSSSYGLVVHLLLLSTPPFRRRSYSRLQAVALTWRGLSPPGLSTLTGALARTILRPGREATRGEAEKVQ